MSMNNNMTNQELAQQEARNFAEDVDKQQLENLPDMNIIVAGITGAGKSTLLNAVFGGNEAETGSGRPVTANMREYCGDHIRIWDTVGLELDAQKTRDSISAIKNTIAKKAANENKYDRIHAIWYCIAASGNRYQGKEVEFIQQLHSVGVPFIIVLTKCSMDETETEEFIGEIRKVNAENNMDDIEVVPVLAKEMKFRGGPSIPAYGCDKLVEETEKRLPDFIKTSFVAAQKVSLSQKRDACEDIICSCVDDARRSFTAKLIGINIIDANTRIKDMLRRIGCIYNTVLDHAQIDQIARGCSLDSDNIFHGLFNPFRTYRDRVDRMLARKKREGFYANVGDFKDGERVAMMVANYGYVFVEAIEELWNQSTMEQLKNMDYVISKMIEYINNSLQGNLK